MANPVPVDTEAAMTMWAEYVLARGFAEEPEPPTVERFGDTAELSDELLGLVLFGQKRATATLVREFAAWGDPMPRIGGHWIACDGAGVPRIVIRTTELRLGTFWEADAAFAFDEAEDDRSLASWRAGHRAYWERASAELGFAWSETDEIVFERFSVVWPPEHAGAPG